MAAVTFHDTPLRRQSARSDGLGERVLLVILLMPLFPPVFGASQIHVNIIAVGLAALLCLAPSARWNAADVLVAAAAILSAQLLLGLTWAFGQDTGRSVADLMSAARPTMMFIVLLFFLSRMGRVTSVDEMDRVFARVTAVGAVVVTLCFVLAVLEVFAPELAAGFMNALYKRGEKIGLASHATTFFGQGYYSGFVLFTLFLLAMARWSMAKSFGALAVIGMAFAAIFFSQSKPMILATVAAMPIYYFLGRGAGTGAIILLVAAAASALFVVFITSHDVVDTAMAFLSSFNTRWSRSLMRMLLDPEASGTLQVRLDQIMTSWELARQSAPFGYGLGREIYLESWPAEVLYRYGIGGLGWFGLLVLVGTLSGMKTSRKLRHHASSHYARALAVWFLFLPVTQSSSLMIETSKMIVLSMMVLALTIVSARVARR